jgi:hypothetical protein
LFLISSLAIQFHATKKRYSTQSTEALFLGVSTCYESAHL